MTYRAGKKVLSTSDYWIGDLVRHVSGAPTGIVVAHNHARGLLQVKWEAGVKEWVPPEEVRLEVTRS